MGPQNQCEEPQIGNTYLDSSANQVHFVSLFPHPAANIHFQTV